MRLISLGFAVGSSFDHKSKSPIHDRISGKQKFPLEPQLAKQVYFMGISRVRENYRFRVEMLGSRDAEPSVQIICNGREAFSNPEASCSKIICESYSRRRASGELSSFLLLPLSPFELGS